MQDFCNPPKRMTFGMLSVYPRIRIRSGHRALAFALRVELMKGMAE